MWLVAMWAQLKDVTTVVVIAVVHEAPEIWPEVDDKKVWSMRTIWCRLWHPTKEMDNTCALRERRGSASNKCKVHSAAWLIVHASPTLLQKTPLNFVQSSTESITTDKDSRSKGRSPAPLLTGTIGAKREKEAAFFCKSMTKEKGELTFGVMVGQWLMQARCIDVVEHRGRRWRWYAASREKSSLHGPELRIFGELYTCVSAM